MEPRWRQDSRGLWFFYNQQRDCLVYQNGQTVPRPPNVPRSMYLDMMPGPQPRQSAQTRPEQRGFPLSRIQPDNTSTYTLASSFAGLPSRPTHRIVGRDTVRQQTESEEDSSDSGDGSTEAHDGSLHEVKTSRESRRGRGAPAPSSQPGQSNMAHPIFDMEQHMRQLHFGPSGLDTNYNFSNWPQMQLSENLYSLPPMYGSDSGIPTYASGSLMAPVVGRATTPSEGTPSYGTSASTPPSHSQGSPVTSQSSSRPAGEGGDGPRFDARINGIAARGKFDTYIDSNLVSMDFIRDSRLLDLSRRIGDKDDVLSGYPRPRYAVDLDLFLRGERYRKPFYVVKDLPLDLVLGADFIREERIEVRYWKRDPEKGKSILISIVCRGRLRSLDRNFPHGLSKQGEKGREHQ